MLGGLCLIALAVLGTMGATALVVVPFAALGGVAWVFRPQRGHEAEAVRFSWARYWRGLPVVSAIVLAGFALGVGARLLAG
ncbi:MAG TPA: hypothetical protein ENK63_03335 [Rhodobacterales bacterium]|nr:hypothetical protein [Rhodobacterales bacterium]